ncbi:Sir2 family NAD-dependent protein deacetylase [Microbulbifer aggregans]|uniref:Sir2 family NAD-dependent protein deacetylase n=1 Tax=Microbulbifer aggregans TaxID=1769779 RepID=UPI001CFE9BA3|nr:Sir2 family NAD-dependent protein deacetylase [Microbulbifer aggregans]
MEKKPINTNKIVVFTGAGISAESGLKTFRDNDGLWENVPVELVASKSGWEHDPEFVLSFYNQLRKDSSLVEPNAAHLAIAELERYFDVVVITQNIDNLHERAGSTHVIHLHGELNKARGVDDVSRIYDIGEKPIDLGDQCESGSQLRPHVVWFSETPFHIDSAKKHLGEAAYVLVVGTSLTVQPAASLLKKARYHAKKIIVTMDIERVPFGFTLLRGRATNLVPGVCQEWCEKCNSSS